MKNNISNKNTLMFSWKNAFKDNIVHEPMVSLGNSFELLRLCHSIGWRVISACTDGKVSLFKELRNLKNFAGYLLQMKKHHGAVFTVKYLKSGHLAVLKAISKDRIKGPRDLEPDLPLPRFTTSRLPRFIPLSDRRAILSGNTYKIRLWLSLLSLYRVIKVPGTLKLSTITEPCSADPNAISRGIGDLKVITLRNSFRFDRSILSKEFGLLPIEKSSPTWKSSWRGLITDVHLLVDKGLDLPLLKFLGSIGQDKLFLMFKLIQENPYTKGHSTEKDYYSMGQLAIKEEAAGKVRVFALVDVWTQSCLKPLHEMIFAFLRSLPNDATFDQGAAVKRAQLLAEKYGRSFGYDLSAATDRLPISLQVSILSVLIGQEAAEAWKDLLVSRVYRLSDKKYGDHEVKYEVGQPMGALSSWAMLALTHHLIVQLAYQNIRNPSGPFWYSEYEVLGDDIVLFEEDIANEYLSLMTSYGVGVNLSKSVVAKNKSFEFAKVSSLNGKFVSAISWKMFISQNNFMGRVNILYSLLLKMDIKHVLRYSERITRKGIMDLGAIKLSLLSLLSMFSNSGKISLRELLKTLLQPMDSPRRSILKDASLFINKEYALKLITAIYKGLPLPLRSDRVIDKIAEGDEDWYNITLLKRITELKLRLGTEEQIRRRLTDSLCDVLLPGVIPTGHKEIFWNQLIRGEDLSPEFSVLQDLYFMIRYWAQGLLGDLEFYETGSVDKDKSTLEDLVLVNSKFDRLLEVLSLWERANLKSAGLELSKVKIDSPLKTLQFLKRSKVVKDEVVKREEKGWFVDRREQHFIEDTLFLLQKDPKFEKIRVRYL